MPRRSFRSSSIKKKATRTQTGVHIHIMRKSPGKTRCVCGRVLNSIPSGKSSGPKSRRRSNRPHGGSLCPVCAREKALQLARKQLES